MKRRPLLVTPLAPLFWPAIAAASTGRPQRIAFLAAGSQPKVGQFSTFDTVIAGLRERGYAMLQIRVWYADNRADALPALARQVLAWQPALIITNLTPATLAARRATRDIPILMAGSGDPVATGLVQSLARPGGNVSGVSALGPELAAKSLELLRELGPGLRSVGVLASATDSFTPAMLAGMEGAATQLGLRLLVEQVREPGQYPAAFDAWQRQRVEAVFVQPSLPGPPAADLALQHGWPSASFVRSFVEQGGLLSYANDLTEIARLVTDMADRVLRGASPATLPVQQNTRFDLLINLRTAAALGIKVSDSVRTRTTEFIE